VHELGSRAAEDVDAEHLPGIRMASGSLGQGMSAAIGAALAKKLNKESNVVFSLHGDGELDEGQNWEAIMFAAHHKVDNLISTVDWNGQQIDGTTSQVMNLGNLDAKYTGAEISINAHPTDALLLYASYGYTNSKITGMEDPTVIGNQAPLVTRDTVNAGIQLTEPLVNDINWVARVDYQGLGRTWWDPYNVTSRDPVNLIDARLSLQNAKWALTAWSKNLTNSIYNAEFSPGGFLWKAPPRSYGVEFGYKF